MSETVHVSAPGTRWTVPDPRELALRIRSLRAVRMVAPHGFGYLGQALSSAEQVAAVFAAPVPARDRLVCSPGHYIIARSRRRPRLGLLDEEALATLRAGRLARSRPSAPSGHRSSTTPAGRSARDCPAARASRWPTGSAARTRGSSPWSATANWRRGRSGRRRCSPRHHRLDRLTVLLDANNSQVDGPVDSITTIEPIAAKW